MTWRRHLRPALPDRPPAAGRPPAVRLDANESPFAPDWTMRRRLGELASSVELNRYPDPSSPRLRAALAERLGVDPDRLLVGNGSDELLAMLLTAFGGTAARPARVVYPSPTFARYGLHARTLGLVPVEVPTGEDLQVDPERLAAAIRREDPALVFLSRPNNPTGVQWPRAVVEAASEAATGLVVVDEAYGDYAEETLLDLARERPNTVLLQTLSKVGFAGLRVGWCLAAEPVVREVDKVRLPYNLGRLSETVAVEVVRRWDEWVAPAVETVIGERERLFGALTRAGIDVVPSRANFLLVRVPDPAALTQALAARGIAVRDVSPAGGPLARGLRITVGTPEENRALLEALGELDPALVHEARG